MFDDETAQAASVVLLAEAELAAYLRGVQSVLGCRDPLLSGSAWLDTLESLAWPAADHASFFRGVSILTIIRLVEHSLEPSRNAASERARDRQRGDFDETEFPFISA